jgi:pimeloyl-ACP methyl ester carboxylesterase
MDHEPPTTRAGRGGRKTFFAPPPAHREHAHSLAAGRFSLRLRYVLALIACWAAAGSAGCVGITADDMRLSNAMVDRWERLTQTRNLSEPTGVVLARHGLLKRAATDPAGAAKLLESQLVVRPETDGALGLAELFYQAGLEHQQGSTLAAMAYYRDAAALSVLALAEPDGTRPELAIELHNRALARLIRLTRARSIREDRTWRRLLEEQGLFLETSERYLDPARIADLRVAGDLRVTGMDHLYYTPGLGVPLVAHRLARPTSAMAAMAASAPGPAVASASLENDSQDRFLPRELQTGTTAVIIPGGGLAGGQWRLTPAALVLFDPFVEQSLRIGPARVELASDRTTPLAAQVARGHLATLEWLGLFESDFKRPGYEAALYMMRPYEPGKIPVVFVHGLFSSPRAWMQTINELRNAPELDARFQYWVFLYPTGLPIPASAARLRDSLVDVRESLDPLHQDRAFEQMVLVGHSMGGILSKMMVQDSGLTLWDATITVPHDRFKAPPQLRSSLDHVLVFQRLPFVRRVVFVATPHRGSPIANSLFGRTISDLVRRPIALASRMREIEELNGPHVISRELRSQPLNAIGNLRTDSPILAALDHIAVSPEVPYHSIIPSISGKKGGTDGVVEYGSSHLDRAESELIVAGTHSSQEAPTVTRELRRILLEHLTAGDPAVMQAKGP